LQGQQVDDAGLRQLIRELAALDAFGKPRSTREIERKTGASRSTLQQVLRLGFRHAVHSIGVDAIAEGIRHE